MMNAAILGRVVAAAGVLVAVLGTVLGGCDARSVVAVRNETDVAIRAVVVMGSIDGAVGSRPDDRLFYVSLRPSEAWSSDGEEGQRSTIVVGRTVVYVPVERGAPVIYSLPSPKRVSLRVVGGASSSVRVVEESMGELERAEGNDYGWLRETIERDPVVRMRLGLK